MNTSSSKTAKLTSISHVRTLLGELEIHPSKVLGQNFLVDQNIRTILIAAAEIHKKDVILEAGPGLGVLTEELVAHAGKVVVVEKDSRLAAHLVDRFEGVDRLTIINQDMLTVDIRDIGANKFFSNLPYSVGSRILVELAQSPARPVMMVVTVQQEVAKRIKAGVGSEEYGLLTLWLGLDYEVSSVKVISPTCFWPAPEVRSEAVKLVRREREIDPVQRAAFYVITKLAFGYRRKKLLTVLRGKHDKGGQAGADAGELLDMAGISPDCRAEDVQIDEWLSLATHSLQTGYISLEQ